MAQRHQLVSWFYLEASEGSSAPERFVPGDPSLWKVIEDNVGALEFAFSEALLVDWGEGKESLSDDDWRALLTLPGACEVSTSEVAPLPLSIQVRSRSRHADEACSLLLAYFATHQLPSPKSVQKLRIITITGPGAKPEKMATLQSSLEKLVQFGAKSGLFDPAYQDARVVAPGAVNEWKFSTGLEDGDSVGFLDQVRQARRHPLSTKYVVKETGAKFKDGDVVTTVSPLDILTSAPSGNPSFVKGLEPLTLILGLQARHSNQYSKMVQRDLERVSAFRERGVSLAYASELYPFSSFFEVQDGFCETYIRNFESQEAGSFLYVTRPYDSRNAYESRKFERFEAKVSKLSGVQSHTLALEFGLCTGIARLAAKASGMMLFDVALKEITAWDIQQTGYERCLLIWVPDASKRELEKIARHYDVSVLVTGQKHDRPFLTIISEKDEVVDVPVVELMSVLQTQSEAAVMGTWAYEDDRRPAYGFERANIYPDRFLMRSTQKNKLEMEVGTLLASYFSGDLSRVSLQRGSFSYPLNAMRWSDGLQTYIEAGGQVRGISRYNPRLLGITVVDEAVRWLVTQGTQAAGALGSVYVSMPGSDLQALSSRQRAALSLAFDGLTSACKEFGIRVTNVRYSPHSGPSQQFELIFRISKVVDPQVNFTIPGFRMEDEILYAVGPKPPFVDAGSKILPYVRVVSNHVTELSFSNQISLYRTLGKCIEDSIISCMRPISSGGVAEGLGEMALWSGLGAKIKPSVPTIEIFSGAPGRFVVGVLPQFAKQFESLIPSEMHTNLGTSGGNKVLSLPLTELFESRNELASLKEDVV